MTKITPEQAYNAAKLLFPNIADLKIKRGVETVHGRGNALLGRGDPMFLRCEIEWPEGVTEWPKPRLCDMCGTPIGSLVHTDRDLNEFCCSRCQEVYAFHKADVALENAVKLIQHLGGNPCMQIKALALIGPMRKTPAKQQP